MWQLPQPDFGLYCCLCCVGGSLLQHVIQRNSSTFVWLLIDQSISNPKFSKILNQVSPAAAAAAALGNYHGRVGGAYEGWFYAEHSRNALYLRDFESNFARWPPPSREVQTACEKHMPSACPHGELVVN